MYGKRSKKGGYRRYSKSSVRRSYSRKPTSNKGRRYSTNGSRGSGTIRIVIEQPSPQATRETFNMIKKLPRKASF